MNKGHDCNETFQNGIVNGAYWYELSGGMQDFNYVFTNCFEITLELSCCKFPPKTELPEEWKANKKSLLDYIKLTHIGARGLVKDSNGYPIRDAEIEVQGVEDKPIKTTERGEFWRLLTPGTYNIRAVSFGWVDVTLNNCEEARVGVDELEDSVENHQRHYHKIDKITSSCLFLFFHR